MSSIEETVKKARLALSRGDKEGAIKILSSTAETEAKQGNYDASSKLYEELGKMQSRMYMAFESFEAFENATLMLIRKGHSPETHTEIVRLNMAAARIAEEATEYKRAADFYFRAADFAEDEEDKQAITIRAADSLEDLADTKEIAKEYSETISLLKKVGRIYYSAGDEELSERIYRRAEKIAREWARTAKAESEFLAAGNALAEAAQILQILGDSVESTKMMMDAGEFYEIAGLYEKAGNIYDAAQEAYQLQRLSVARKQAMSKAAEAYLKMDGKPEILAPLLVKAGNLFKELGRVMKAKWAFKKANELFGELAQKSADDEDYQSEKTYLRYRAMCLKNWGRTEEAEEIYNQVITYFLDQAKKEEEANNKEFQAVSLEEAAEVLAEADKKEKATEQLEEAISIYVDLAKEYQESQPDEASKFYSKAAECAGRLGDDERRTEYHRISSEMAAKAAKFYEELEVEELATIWLRTAGREALLTEDISLVESAIQMLEKSAHNFKQINEFVDAFEDLFEVFEAVYTYNKSNKDKISEVLRDMREIGQTIGSDYTRGLLSVLQELEKDNHIAALMALQEREEELLDKKERLTTLIESSKDAASDDDYERTGRTHWLYK